MSDLSKIPNKNFKEGENLNESQLKKNF